MLVYITHIYVYVRKRKRGHSAAGLLPRCHNDWHRADLKLGASSRSPTWVQGSKVLGHPPAAFPGHKHGAGLEVEQVEQELAPIQDAGAAG